MAVVYILEFVSNAGMEEFLTMCSERGVLYPLFIFADTCQVADIAASVITIVQGPNTNIEMIHDGGCFFLLSPGLLFVLPVIDLMQRKGSLNWSNDV